MRWICSAGREGEAAGWKPPDEPLGRERHHLLLLVVIVVPAKAHLAVFDIQQAVLGKDRVEIEIHVRESIAQRTGNPSQIPCYFATCPGSPVGVNCHCDVPWGGKAAATCLQ